MAIWISNLHDFSLFQSRSHPATREEMLKIVFQDGGCSSHFGFLIGSVLAILCLLGTLMLLIKFQFNWIIEEMSKI